MAPAGLHLADPGNFLTFLRFGDGAVLRGYLDPGGITVAYCIWFYELKSATQTA
jgi:hypothetical protein